MEKTIDQVIGEETVASATEEIQDRPEKEMEEKQSIFDILMVETGPGDFKDPVYMEHPFNFNNSEAMARIIRGLTGIVGELRLAIIDILIGSYQFFGGKNGA